MSEEKKPRSSKADIAQYISYILDLIASNKPKAVIVKKVSETFNIKSHQANRYFIQATEQLESDLADKTKAIRDRRIHALNRDVSEAYKNYKKERDPKIKVKWFEVYQNVKNQLDSYYPSRLSPDEEKEDNRIEIIFQTATKKDDKDDNEDM